MILSHDSYNSGNDLSTLFCRTFADSEIKCRHTMLYGIAPEFKENLLRDKNWFKYFTIIFDKILNSELQMCQMDAVIRYLIEHLEDLAEDLAEM